MLMRFFAAIGIPVDATRLLVNSMAASSVARRTAMP